MYDPPSPVHGTHSLSKSTVRSSFATFLRFSGVHQSCSRDTLYVALTFAYSASAAARIAAACPGDAIPVSIATKFCHT